VTWSWFFLLPFVQRRAPHQYNPQLSRARAYARAPMISMYIKNSMTQAATASGSPQPAATASGRRIQVRLSGVHGKGVFALAPIVKGEVIIEYKGEVITWPEALRRHPHDPIDPNHTFYFHVDEEHVIDAKHGGNAARWINHACAPNCEADEVDGRVFIKALRALKPGEELFYDYGLIIDERYTPKLKKEYACRCGSKKCRGTMLAPKG
jgi:uncharacterized protein